jgi:hypothetical protein
MCHPSLFSNEDNPELTNDPTKHVEQKNAIDHERLCHNAGIFSSCFPYACAVLSMKRGNEIRLALVDLVVLLGGGHWLWIQSKKQV